MYRKNTLPIVLSVVLLLITCLFSPLAVLGQDETSLLSDTPMQLVDIPFGDGWVISAPEDWLVWQPGDYETPEEAEAAFNEMYQSVDADYVPQAGSAIQFYDITNFMIFRPELLNGEVVIFSSFEFLSRSEFAEFAGVSPDEVDASVLEAQLYTNAINDTVELNGREALVTVSPTSESVTYILNIVLEDSEEIVNVGVSLPLAMMSVPEIDQVATALTMTARMEGEAIDVEAWEAIAESRWGDQAVEYTDLFILPAEDGAEATPDATDAPEAETTQESDG